MGCAHGKGQETNSPTVVVEDYPRANRSNVASPVVVDKSIGKTELPVLHLPVSAKGSPVTVTKAAKGSPVTVTKTAKGSPVPLTKEYKGSPISVKKEFKGSPNPAPLSNSFLKVSASPQAALLGDEAYGTDLDLELNPPRFSQVSNQFCPPNGPKVVSVPGWNYQLRYSYLTQRGYYPEALDKENQDSLCAHTPFGNDPNDHFFGVFDGHGEFGSLCSQFAKRQLCENLLRNRHFTKDALKAYHSAFVATNLQLHRYHIDDSMSGTTGITVLVRGKTLSVANVGDSRAVVAERRGRHLYAVDLSNDQTPFRADESARVRLCGARVLTLDQLEGLKNPDIQCWGGEEDDDGDPPRLWVANGMYPGTAFTRSIGDIVAEQIGVIAVPEVLIMELTSSHPFFVVASDGVFEFLSSQAVVDMVAKHKDPQEACASIVAESYRLWLQNETRTDDITVIVVHIDGLQDSAETRDIVNNIVANGSFHSSTPAIEAIELERGEGLPVFGGEPRQFPSAGRIMPREPTDLPVFSLDEDHHYNDSGLKLSGNGLEIRDGIRSPLNDVDLSSSQSPLPSIVDEEDAYCVSPLDVDDLQGSNATSHVANRGLQLADNSADSSKTESQVLLSKSDPALPDPTSSDHGLASD